jgi:hypothetical protein
MTDATHVPPDMMGLPATEPPPEPPPDTDTTEGPPDVQASIRYVPFEDLYLEYKFWANPRSQTGLDDQSIQDLAASILSGTKSSGDDEEALTTHAGVRVPLEVVMVRANGSFINLVIDGQRRHRGIEAADLPPDTLVPVIDLEPEPIEWTREVANAYLLRALEAVGTRAGLSSFELSESAQRLRESKDAESDKEYTLAKIARSIGRSESWVSKILAARKAASPKLLHSWKTGEITDEQFKDLASQKDTTRQRADADAVVRARQAGDKGGARTLAKEQKLVAKAAKPPAATAATKGATPAGKATPATWSDVPPKAKAPDRKPPAFAVVEDFLGLAKKRPPTHDYVRGLMDGARWAVGLMDASKFGKPWEAYMRHVQGEKPPHKVKGGRPLAPHGKKRR